MKEYWFDEIQSYRFVAKGHLYIPMLLNVIFDPRSTLLKSQQLLVSRCKVWDKSTYSTGNGEDWRWWMTWLQEQNPTFIYPSSCILRDILPKLARYGWWKKSVAPLKMPQRGLDTGIKPTFGASEVVQDFVHQQYQEFAWWNVIWHAKNPETPCKMGVVEKQCLALGDLWAFKM